jgi:hypothetical protein
MREVNKASKEEIAALSRAQAKTDKAIHEIRAQFR